MIIPNLIYKYSAPGKAILSGEHSVVYGMPCIAFSVNVRSTVETTLCSSRLNNNKLLVHCKDFNSTFEYSWDTILREKQETLDIIKNMNDGKPFDTMIELLRKIAYDSVPSPKESHLEKMASILTEQYSVTISVESQIPYNSGMGSSASVSVALSASLLKFFNTVCTHIFGKSSCLFSDKESFLNSVNDYSLYGEKLLHGNPSGVDNCVITRGGVINFTKTSNGGKYEKISNRPNFSFCILNSHTKRFTCEIIKRVRLIKESFPKLFMSLINSIKQCTLNMIEIVNKKDLSESDEERLINLVKMNHKMLSSLQISNQNIESIIDICSHHGVIAKLTGAGMGGSLIGIIKNSNMNETNVNELKKELTQCGFSMITTEFDAEGLHEIEATL